MYFEHFEHFLLVPNQMHESLFALRELPGRLFYSLRSLSL
jgi:hypothetical protein